MRKIKIKVRKESVKCSECRKENDFFYLSDFSYGEKLIIYDEGRKYAFINLLEDNSYKEFEVLINEIMEENGKIAEDGLINNLFEITCDPISRCLIDFRHNKRKCNYCESYVFDANLLEPEKLVDIEVPIVTHEIWESLNSAQKREKIENVLRSRGILTDFEADMKIAGAEVDL